MNNTKSKEDINDKIAFLLQQGIKRKLDKGMLLENIERDTGVSISTISRVARGIGVPETGTIEVLAKYLQIPMDGLFSASSSVVAIDPEKPIIDQIEAQILNDPNLTSDSAKGLTEMFRKMYESFSGSNNLENMSAYQDTIEIWSQEVFGDDIACDMLERIMRFLEEAIELAQAEGMTQAEVNRVTDYVFNRNIGDCNQEVGGVMVTLAAYCSKKGISMSEEAIKEYHRINTPEMKERIFGKQAFKRSQGLTSDGGFRKPSEVKED